MLLEQILTVFIVPRFFHKSSVRSLRSVFRRRETKVERTLYSTITNPNKRSKSLFHRRRPPLLLKESECRSISGIIGSRIVAAPKNNPMTSPPLGRCYLFSTGWGEGKGKGAGNAGKEEGKKLPPFLPSRRPPRVPGFFIFPVSPLMEPLQRRKGRADPNEIDRSELIQTPCFT